MPPEQMENHLVHQEIIRCNGFVDALQVPGLMENRPSVLKGDHLFVSHSSNNADADKTQHCEYKGYVHQVHASKVCLGFGDQYVMFCFSFIFCLLLLFLGVR